MLGSLVGGERRTVTPWASADDSSFYGGVTSSAGQVVTTDTAMQLLAVYGCVGLISDVISTLPVAVFNADTSKAATPRWLRQPNPESDWATWVGEFLMGALLDGNAYVSVVRNPVGDTGEMWLLDPSRVDVTRASDHSLAYTIGGVRWPGELLHVPSIKMPQQLKGLSPLEAARQSIGLGLGALEFGARFFANGAALSGVIETPSKLTDDQARFMKRNWLKGHSGARAHEPGVLTEGAKWNQVSVSPEQAQFLATRQYTAAEIAGQLFRVDPSMLGIPTESKGAVTYQNIEQRGIHLVQFTLLPWIVRLENLCTALLPPGQYMKLNVAGLLRADLRTRYESYAIALGSQGSAPFMTVDEVRALEEREPMPPSASPTNEVPPP